MTKTITGPSRRQFIVGAGALAGSAAIGGPLRFLSAESATTAALPDLVVTAVGVPKGIIAGQPVKFGVIVKNQGAGATPKGKEIGVAFHVDGKEVCWSGDDFGVLPAGVSITLYSSGGPERVATWTATAGNHIVTATVNDVKRFAEVSFTNNSRSLAFTVAAALTKPSNTSLPVITGTPTVGHTLSVSEGTWS